MKKTPKLIVLTTIVILLFSFMPAVLGKANSRPIKDFTDTNNYVAAWHDPESNLIVFPHGFWVTPPGTEVIADCEHSGSVLERDLKDGRILFIVNLHVKGAWILIAYYGDRLIFVGEMDYHFTAILIVEGNLGDPVPNLLDVWFYGLGEAPFSHITGSGTGTFVDDDAAIEQGFTPGATVNVKMNQVGITKPEGHPFYPGMWPVELIFFH